mmetsp:Transcript_99886/g.285583  ORF Transcript_99886/g.285583 Transcript_99886/m.285583 type:complete len:115 (-) Transcript_99886:119-463(-)
MPYFEPILRLSSWLVSLNEAPSVAEVKKGAAELLNRVPSASNGETLPVVVELVAPSATAPTMAAPIEPTTTRRNQEARRGASACASASRPNSLLSVTGCWWDVAGVNSAPAVEP